MSEDRNCDYSEFKPTIWHRLGFGRARRSLPEQDERFVEGALVTESTIYLDWTDRFRTLISGRINHVTITQTDVSVNCARSVSSVKVMPPAWGDY
jgi:hypothetical protein